MRRWLAAIGVILLLAAPARAAEYQAIGAGYQFLGLPDFVISPTFADHQPVMAHGTTIHYALGRWDSHWNFGLALAGMLTPDGWWRAQDTSVSSAVWAEYDVGFLGAFASYTWSFVLWRDLLFSPTVGLGIAGVLGNVHATESIPGCEGDVSQCGHWRNVTREPVDLAARVMPLLILTGSFQYRVTPEMRLSLDLGFIDLPYVGLSAEYALP